MPLIGRRTTFGTMKQMDNFGIPGAASDLGLGADLRQQVATETDEQRRRRMLEQQQQAGGSMAAPMLFGLGGGSAGY